MSENKSENEITEELLRLRSENRILRNLTRYGLNWERKHERIVDESLLLPGSPQTFPILERVPELDVNSPENPAPGLQSNSKVTMIEGDNYDALLNLQYTHKGKIDIIYIDPPYNTGNDDFFYDDKRVDKKDSFRHSKWLSFMAPRLVLARELLSDQGVVFVSIDDHEQATLKLLLNEVFGVKNFVASFFWNKTSTAPSLSKYVRKKYEYVLCYRKTDKLLTLNAGTIDGGDVPLFNKGNKIKKLS